MKKKIVLGAFKWVFIGIILLLLYAPILLFVVYSFVETDMI